jgi:RNA polymerase sigma factor (sigma-70 family)
MHISLSNEEWIAKLCGPNGKERTQVFQALGWYLRDHACWYLAGYLTDLASQEIEAQAHDFAQQTLEKVWQSVCIKGTFRGKTKIKNFAKKILYNEIRQSIRKHKREKRPPLGSRDENEDEDFQENWIARRGGAIVDQFLEDMVEQQEVWREVQEISRDKLSERQRVAFWLRHWLEIKVGIIADLMTVMYGEETTRNAVSALIYQARLRFLEELANSEIDREYLEKVLE